MLESHITTPFGRRTMTLGHLQAQAQARAHTDDTAVDKWQVYRWLCEGKEALEVSDRSLAVLSALLSFLPQTELSSKEPLIVFPSNAQLSLRAHGMAGATLRRHLAALLELGLITRKDSPNGKRYSRKGRGGEIVEAFGFSLAPLLARADEFKRAAAKVQAERMALKLLRERVSLHRRDIAKLIDVAHRETFAGDWTMLNARLRAIVEAIPRRAEIGQLQHILEALEALQAEVTILLEKNINDRIPSTNDRQNERQQQSLESESQIKERPLSVAANVDANHDKPAPVEKPLHQAFSLDTVMRACPEIADYSLREITNWQQFYALAGQVKAYLGISPKAYGKSLGVLGHQNTAIIIACMLQRSETIKAPAAYFRSLIERAERGKFSVEPMLTAALHGKTHDLEFVALCS
ncbi:replication initiation protein RepC [Phyllobacterium sp. 21LDTY02-6]|uniref:plasmid replication protein RepC n=1 Tax=Phyllobacterium sp. 21LDTY02-6 TaxID=2944903 RepID=UPI00201FCD2A|nr:plasmid replication protein RepC [Phyllobacterium sp. 21LDTY02-6]MCO4318122.1 replication initiation protein RepC [Phyllobacterium sp. 21LDTY02-6]